MSQINNLENALLGVIEEYEERANLQTTGNKEREILLQVAVDLEQLIWRHD